MRHWTNPNTFFGFPDVVWLDMEINKYAVRAGYPNWYFSSYSLCRGMVNQKVGDYMLLKGMNQEQAV
jgi:hypothetical protein